MTQKPPSNLMRYGVFSGMLAFVGLPLYIHAPKFFVDEYGLGLGVIGVTLLFLRALDFVQDPLIGWLSDKFPQVKPALALSGVIGLALSFSFLFAVKSPVNPLIWFGFWMALIFTFFSLLTILFYAQGIEKAKTLGPVGHVKLATWRETGALLGICAASIAPLVFGFIFAGTVQPMIAFSLFFVGLALLAAWGMKGEWSKSSPQKISSDNLPWKDPILRRLLFIAFLNAAPVAVTSTLFLFFVEYRLGSETASGPLLLLFFLSAAGCAPIWGYLAKRFGAKNTLILGMLLSVVVFIFTYSLETGQIVAFGIVCIASGAALGADMTLLPALFARRVAQVSTANAQAFGLWSFCSKLTLAIAAATVLPLLDAAGFQAGKNNPEPVLNNLSILYALLPCALKLIALTVLYRTPLKEA